MIGDPVKIAVLVGLCAIFLAIPSIVDSLGSSLDSIPMRFAAAIAILAIMPYDRLVALAGFMVISAIYIQRHQVDLSGVVSSSTMAALSEFKTPEAMESLDQGGHADETLDTMDFVSKEEDQDNEFYATGSSINEKHALQTEGLGSRSQSLFPDDSRGAEHLANSNRNGSHE